MVAAAALALAAIAVIVAITHVGSAVPPSHPIAVATLPVKPASYLGVYEEGEPSTYQPISEFGVMAGVRPNLDGYFSGWPEPFKVGFARTALAHGRYAHTD